MYRVAPLVVVAASALAVSACFPDFQFGPGNEGGDSSSSRAATGTGAGTNAGGDGGAPSNGVGGSPGQGGSPSHGGQGSGGNPATGGSTTTGTVEMPTVPCGDGNSMLVECTPGQQCCFSSETPDLDHCGASGSCNDYVFSCNEPSDCATGVCCADEDLFGFTGTISCVSSCAGGARLCEQASDCSPGETCSQYFSNSYAPEYAPGYKVCKP